MRFTYLHAYSILDMNVTGFTLRTVSIMYTTTVGNAEPWRGEGFIYMGSCCIDPVVMVTSASVIMDPEADHVKTSI